MNMTAVTVEASANSCTNCNRSVLPQIDERGLCQCAPNQAGEPINTSRDPIWADDFPGTNESGIRPGQRIYRNDFALNVWETLKGRTTAVCRWLTTGCLNGRNITDRVTNRSFMCGSLLLVFGAYLLVFPDDDLGFQRWSLVMIGVGGLFVWIPVFFWMNDSRQEGNTQQETQPPRPHVTTLDRPPSYDTLVGLPPSLPKDSPPPYDQVFPEGAEDNVILPQCSGATSVNVPICLVHQPTPVHPIFSEFLIQRTAVESPPLQRSRSLIDLS